MTKKDREEHFSEKEALVFHAQGKPGKIEIKTSFIFFINDKYYLVKKNKKSVINAFPAYKELIKKSKLRFKDEEDFLKFLNLL